MEIYSSDLEYYRSKDLRTAADIVQHSSIVPKSLEALNLKLCQSYTLWGDYTDCNYPSFSHSREMINTEEKCRKTFTKSRSLLYTLHLDLPGGRDWSLKSDSEPRNPAKIYVAEDFFTLLLYHYIDYACEYSDHNLKVLKWFIKFDVLGKSAFRRLPHFIMNYFFECMHPGLDDSEFVTECFKKLDLTNWLYTSHSSKPGRVSNLLYQFYRNGKNVDEELIDEFIGLCLCLSFQHIGDVLKLKNTPNLCVHTFRYYLVEFLHERFSMISRKVTAEMSRQRQTLLYQVCSVSFDKTKNLSEASEFLRLIWNSVPDSFLSSDEIAKAFKKGIDTAETSDIYDFYSEAVGALHTYNEPRSLKHYCRTRIRWSLYKNKNWLPEGIQKIGLPVKLQSYLSLEE